MNLRTLTQSKANALLHEVSQSTDIAEARAMFGNKTFLEANRSNKIFANATATAAQVVSAVLASSFIYFKIALPAVPFEVMYLTQGIAVLLSLLALGILEILKKQLFHALFISFFKSKSRAVSLKVWLIPLCGLLTVISVYTSFEGAKLFVSQSDKSDLIAGDYQKQLATLENEEKTFKNAISWKGKIDTYNKTNAKILAGFEDRRTALHQEKNKEIGTHKGDIEGKGLSVALFSLFMEILAVACFGFVCYVNFYVFVETHAPQASHTDSQEESNQVQKIGFSQVPNSTIAPNSKVGFQFGQNLTSISTNNNAMRIDAMRRGNCKHCGNEFEKRTTWQKYCNEECRVSFWEAKTGKKLKKKGGQK